MSACTPNGGGSEKLPPILLLAEREVACRLGNGEASFSSHFSRERKHYFGEAYTSYRAALAPDSVEVPPLGDLSIPILALGQLIQSSR